LIAEGHVFDWDEDEMARMEGMGGDLFGMLQRHMAGEVGDPDPWDEYESYDEGDPLDESYCGSIRKSRFNLPNMMHLQFETFLPKVAESNGVLDDMVRKWPMGWTQAILDNHDIFSTHDVPSMHAFHTDQELEDWLAKHCPQTKGMMRLEKLASPLD